MKTLTIDTETTIEGKGNPFNRDNKLCLVGTLDNTGKETIYDIEYSAEPYSTTLAALKVQVEEADLLIGFNLKFDLHWLRRYINDIRFPAVWDCQLGEFILSCQRDTFPSLDISCARRGLGSKSNVVSNEYWEAGIDTTKIPRDILYSYLSNDLALTSSLYLSQLKELKDNKLFKLHCSDLLVLEEMEYNGMVFATDDALNKANELEIEIGQIDKELSEVIGCAEVNFNSSDHLSSILYGGSCRIPSVVATERVLKDGTVKNGTKQGVKEIVFPRLVNPLARTETLPTKAWDDYSLQKINKERIEKGLLPHIRIYSIDKGTLRSLKAKGKSKEIIDLYLRRSEVEKLLSTYFRGIPEIIQKCKWSINTVHGQFNQCVARTGRLSASKPNLQNVAEEVKPLFRSRYA